MIGWNEVAGWMGFPYLSQSAGISYSYALGYRLKDGGGEPWTARFNRFKANEKAAIYGGARLLYGAVPKLIAALDVDRGECVFITALSSGETNADLKRALPYITRESAGIVGIRFELDALTKNAHGKIHNLYSVDGRNAELDKAEYKSKKLEAKKVFVFDDLITRGDTLSRIALAASCISAVGTPRALPAIAPAGCGALRIEIDNRHGVAGCDGRGRQMHRDCCLSGAALLADDRYRFHGRVTSCPQEGAAASSHEDVNEPWTCGCEDVWSCRQAGMPTSASRRPNRNLTI
jgi:hypothetical protein